MLMSSLTVQLLLLPVVLWLLKEFVLYLRRGYYVHKLQGPECKYFTGNLFDISVPSDKLFTNLRLWASKWKIYKLWSAYYPTINIFHPDDVEMVLSSMKHIEKGKIYELLHEWLALGLLTSTGEKWHNRRKLLTPTFHFSILQQFVPIFYEYGELIAEAFGKVPNQPVDIVPYVTDLTLRTICETSLGTKLTEKDEHYRKGVEDFGLTVLYRVKRPWFYIQLTWFMNHVCYQQRRITKLLHNFSENVINARRENYKTSMDNKSKGKDDEYLSKKRLAMLDLLLESEREGKIDHAGIKEEVDTFVFEGHDTTSMSICFTLMLLANNPDVQAKVFEEISSTVENPEDPITYNDVQNMNYLDRVIKESLRLFPSVPFMARCTGEDMTTKTGYFIAKGTLCNIHLFDIHYIPEYWPEPKKFDPDRFLPENIQGRHPYCYVPFSAGPRNCIGQKFAMLELKTILSCILRKFKLEPIDSPDTITIMTDIIIRPMHGIKVKFVPRN